MTLYSFNTTQKEFSPVEFTENALEIFRYQFKNNKLYSDFVKNLNINPNSVQRLEEIPFLPIEFFKYHEIKSDNWKSETIFRSSGTTGSLTSAHHVKSIEEYVVHAKTLFEAHYFSLDQVTFLGLLPSYLERADASLVHMARAFIEWTNNPLSGFFLNDYDQILERIQSSRKENKKIVLLGVTFALLDLASHCKGENLEDVIIMDTGGMKGRRKELIRSEVYQTLRSHLNAQYLHSEYGMTELLSQAYADKEGKYQQNNALRVLVREMNDPLSYATQGATGLLNVIDLANKNTCSFIATQDIGKINPSGTFEILGRMDNSDVRGCNLMVF